MKEKSTAMKDNKEIEPEINVKWLTSILDSIYDGVLVADASGIVRYVNPEYTRITGVKYNDIVGRYLHEVRPGAILPQVIRTGQALEGVYRREGDVEYVVDMAPILIDGRVVGGVSVVKDITEVQRLSQELQKHTKRVKRLKSIVNNLFRARFTFTDILGESNDLRFALNFARRIAQQEYDVLITGESGTGKEMFAQAIHNASSRADGPFVAVNCAALTPSLIESELFGYGEGAFTGAIKGGKIGLFEIADGGTIMLDEITELSIEMQAKLLRVLEERTIRRVGEAVEIPVNVRVIAATNKNLSEYVKSGRLREDIYYRLNVINLHLPPLRERGNDVKILTDHFLNLCSKKTGRPLAIHESTYEILMRYPWPGNIRELRHAIEFAVNMCENKVIMPQHLPKTITGLTPFTFEQTHVPLAETVREVERKVISEALKKYGDSVAGKKQAAKVLGISLATLYNKMKTLGISKQTDQKTRVRHD